MSHLLKEQMDSHRNPWPVVFLMACVVLLAGGLLLPESATAQESTLTQAPSSLPASAEPDTVRSNIWLTEALMAEIAASSTRVLPGPGSAIQLIQEQFTVEDDLYAGAVVRVLGGMGYDVYLGSDDPAQQAAVDCFYSYSVHGVELAYPQVGRTLGLWRRWIDRELQVTVQVKVTMANSGRLLLNDRIQRSFSDRVPDDAFDRVDSDLYLFSTAETSESGWKGRMEEIVVLGTLAGLVAVYFANTGE